MFVQSDQYGPANPGKPVTPGFNKDLPMSAKNVGTEAMNLTMEPDEKETSRDALKKQLTRNFQMIYNVKRYK